MKLTDEEREAVRDALEVIPTAIKKGLLNSNSATNKLNWADLAMRLIRDPVGRPVSDIDIENKRKAAEILRAAVPELEKIRDQHKSERLRKKAAQYLQVIASEVPSG